MTIKFPNISFSKYTLLFAVLCVIALIGYTQAAVDVHLSFLDMTHTSSFSLVSVFGGSESLLDRLDLPIQFGLDESDLSGMLAEIHILDIMEDAVRRVVLSTTLYIAALILLLAVFVLTFLDKFKLAKIVMLSITLVLYIVAGFAILSVQEITFDIISNILEDVFAFFAQFINLSEIIHIELAIGYWITVLALAGMFLLETVFFIWRRK
jgi:lysylphosphatidylglycerol synthetase-like protein (DUF2156 family)